MVHQVRHRLCTCCDTVLPHHQYPAADCLEYPRFVFEPFYDKRRVQRRRSTTTTNLAFEEAEQLQMLKDSPTFTVEQTRQLFKEMSLEL